MSAEFYTYSFEKLEVWQLARVFKKEMYLMTQGFPKEEQYGYISQIETVQLSVSKKKIQKNLNFDK